MSVGRCQGAALQTQHSRGAVLEVETQPLGRGEGGYFPESQVAGSQERGLLSCEAPHSRLRQPLLRDPDLTPGTQVLCEGG